MGAIGYFTTLIFGFVIITGKETVTHGLLYPVSGKHKMRVLYMNRDIYFRVNPKQEKLNT